MTSLTASPKSLQTNFFPFPERILARYKETQRKLDSLKVKYRMIESSRSRSVPRINSSSKKQRRSLQSPSYSYFKMVRTQEVLKNSRFMPKNLKVSLISLGNSSPKANPEPIVKESVKITSSRDDSGLFYPSLTRPRSLKKSKSSNLPSEIENRNKLLFSLRAEASTRGFIAEPEEPPEGSDIVSRTKRWLIRKKNKLEEVRASLDSKVKSSCTFQPILLKRRYFSDFRNLTTKSSEGSYCEIYSKKLHSLGKLKKPAKTLKINKPSSSLPSSPRRFMNENPFFTLSPYNNVTPIKMSLAYRHGFSYQLKNKFKPMLDYTRIAFKGT